MTLPNLDLQSQIDLPKEVGDWLGSLGFSDAQFEREDLHFHSAGQPSPKCLTRQTVLCIEDDDDFAKLLEVSLRRRGYEMVRATHVCAGFRYAIEFAPAAILLDLSLRQGDGFEVLQRIRSNQVCRNIPVIVMTGRCEPGLKQKMLLHGAADLLQKPVSGDLLVEMVRHHTNSRGQSTSV